MMKSRRPSVGKTSRSASRYGDDVAASPAAGKVTRTSRLAGGAPLQCKGGSGTRDPGMATSVGTELPNRARLETQFGHSFSGVRVHQGDGRAESMGSLAYARGSDIHISGSAPELNSEAGTHLLGHELTHVVQQRQGAVTDPARQHKSASGASPRLADSSLEAEADSIGSRVAAGESVSGQIFGRATGAERGQSAGGQPIQMFGSLEHQTFGNEGARAAGYTGTFRQETGSEMLRGKPSSVFNFVLTHGDIVMLSGDYFDPREKDDKGKPVPDNLFALAKTASFFPGQVPGTQDEIMYAIKHARPGDPRFDKQCGKDDPQRGIWGHLKFSKAVKDAVDDRYMRLADANTEHFASPHGPGSGGPKSTNRSSGGGSYRAIHKSAILKAHDAKKQGEPINEAMAHEAASEHFLTDAFASGHMRTPRASIADHWNGKYPLFFENLKKTIAQDVAIYMNDHETNAATIGGSVLDIMGPVMSDIDEKTSNLPAFGFDDIVALITHDVDNETGLWVTNDLKMQWKTFGDSHGGVKADHAAEEAETREKIVKAVQLSVADVQHAYAADASKSDAEVLTHVQATTLTPGKPGGPKFGAEQMMPFPDPSMSSVDGELGWKQGNFNDLWKAEVRSTLAITYGARILEAMQANGEFGKKLAGLGTNFPAKKKVYKEKWGRKIYVGTLHPKKAYENSFLGAMTSPGTTKRKIQSIIDYNPGRGQHSSRTDDATRKDMDRLENKGKDMARDGKPGPDGKPADKYSLIRGLTLEQRYRYVRNLESWQGLGTSEGEEERIVLLFETCPKGQRKKLYRMLEGHKWTGNFRKGWTVTDDDLWDNLDGADLKKLRRLLNES